MNFLAELKTLMKILAVWGAVLLFLIVIFVFLGPKQVILKGKTLFLPLPQVESFAVIVLNQMTEKLLPEGVSLVATNPFSAFVSQMTVAFAIAFVLSFPVLLFQLFSFLSPALMQTEKKAIIKTILSVSLLFVSGCLFAYFFLMPATIRLLYFYTQALGALSLFSLTEFVNLIFGFSVAVGLMFQLPVLMFVLVFLGIVKPVFWQKHWREAILAFLAIAAIITPDGSGVTMILLSLPLICLYFAGWLFSKRAVKNVNEKVELIKFDSPS